MNNSLRHYRKKMGFTLQKLADASGVGMSTIGNIETGTTRGSEEFWDKMAETLRVSRENLLRETPEIMSSSVAESPPELFYQELSLQQKLDQMTKRAIHAEEKVELMKKVLRSLLDQL